MQREEKALGTVGLETLQEARNKRHKFKSYVQDRGGRKQEVPRTICFPQTPICTMPHDIKYCNVSEVLAHLCEF